MPTRQTINLMALKFFPHTIILSDIYQMERFSNWLKIERMVSNYFSSCNSEQLKILLKKSGTRTSKRSLGQVITDFLPLHVAIVVYISFSSFLSSLWSLADYSYLGLQYFSSVVSLLSTNYALYRFTSIGYICTLNHRCSHPKLNHDKELT